jgi:DNA (cytosine-5)-methyltransferase 1
MNWTPIFGNARCAIGKSRYPRALRCVDQKLFRKMNVLDLFSGIGGFSLGLERAGMRTVAFCERDEYCRAVLRKHWPDVPCFGDIHAIDADGLGRLGRIDLVCGGFPCQPFSVAGKQKGKEDDRHLWPEMCRVIALARPAWVVGENVAGLVAMALDDVLFDLESLGYTARTFVIPAAAVGAPHRRDRLWIVATDTNRTNIREQSGRCDGSHGEGPLQPGNNGAAPNVADTNGAEWRAIGEARGVQGEHSLREWQEGPSGSGGRRADVAHATSIGEREQADQADAISARRPAWLESSGGSWWSTEPDVGRVAHGVPSRVDRLRCLGNAVVPQIPEIIGRAIMRASDS